MMLYAFVVFASGACTSDGPAPAQPNAGAQAALPNAAPGRSPAALLREIAAAEGETYRRLRDAWSVQADATALDGLAAAVREDDGLSLLGEILAARTRDPAAWRTATASWCERSIRSFPFWHHQGPLAINVEAPPLGDHSQLISQSPHPHGGFDVEFLIFEQDPPVLPRLDRTSPEYAVVLETAWKGVDAVDRDVLARVPGAARADRDTALETVSAATLAAAGETRIADRCLHELSERASDSPRVRVYAFCVGALRDARALPVLKRYLEDDKWYVGREDWTPYPEFVRALVALRDEAGLLDVKKRVEAAGAEFEGMDTAALRGEAALRFGFQLMRGRLAVWALAAMKRAPSRTRTVRFE